jgi:hypothetical protein
MIKLCIDEIGGVKMKKKHVLQFEKHVSFVFSFLVVPLALHFKDDL